MNTKFNINDYVALKSDKSRVGVVARLMMGYYETIYVIQWLDNNSMDSFYERSLEPINDLLVSLI